MIDLIDKKKEQLKLGEAFEKTLIQAAVKNTHILAKIRYSAIYSNIYTSREKLLSRYV